MDTCELCGGPLIGSERRYCSNCNRRCGVCHLRKPCREEDMSEDEFGREIAVCLECAGHNVWHEEIFGRAA